MAVSLGGITEECVPLSCFFCISICCFKTSHSCFISEKVQLLFFIESQGSSVSGTELNGFSGSSSVPNCVVRTEPGNSRSWG